MNVKKFYYIHGRFPTQLEFRQIREHVLRNQQNPKVHELSDNDLFVEAARVGDIETLERLVNSISGIDCVSRILIPSEKEVLLRPSALCIAAQNNQCEAVSWLIEHGAKIDTRSHGGRTAILYAAEGGNFDCMNLLIRKGATHFTYTDQQVESQFVAYTIRQSITRRELSYLIENEDVAGHVLDFLGLGGQRIRILDRYTPKTFVSTNNDIIISPIPEPAPLQARLFHPPRVSHRRDMNGNVSATARTY